MDRKHRPRVALLIESSRAYGRGLLYGIADYVHAYGPWSIFFHERLVGDPAPRELRQWDLDGMIVRIEDRRLLEMVKRMKLPTVDLFGRHRLPNVPVLIHDPRTAGRLGAEHLLERGFERFGYCGLAGVHFSEQRQRYFEARLAEAGSEASVFEAGTRKTATVDVAGRELRNLARNKALMDWLRSLPKPVGLMACNDPLGQQILTACGECGFAVPEEVAVIGVDNDELVCELCDPPLSSIQPNNRKTGFEAAALLDRMMKGEAATDTVTLVPSLGDVARQSTDVMAIPDADTAAAVQYIREHACDGLDVENVLRRVLLSRSTLERRFQRYLGRTPRAEINRVRLSRVKYLLESTDLPLVEIAELSGFRHVERMCTLFKTHEGRTPGQHRKAARVHASRQTAVAHHPTTANARQ